MTCYPPEVYRDRLYLRPPNARTTERAPSSAIVQTRHHSHAGYVEITTHV